MRISHQGLRVWPSLVSRDWNDVKDGVIHEAPRFYYVMASGVPRVFSARGPMLASAHAPPCHIGLHGWRPLPLRAPFGKNKPFGPKKTHKQQKGSIGSAGPLEARLLKLAPTSWAGAPFKAGARGPWPPPPGGHAPPLGTPLVMATASMSRHAALTVTHIWYI